MTWQPQEKKGERNMKIMIDTNIVLDLLLKRSPFVGDAVKLFEQAEKKRIDAYITANSVTDIVYILRKAYSLTEIKEHLRKLFSFINIAGITPGDVSNALDLNAPDFEDALLMQCARRYEIDIIVTRNKEDFKYSPVKCADIKEWAKQL